MAEENESRWNASSDKEEESSDYHVTTSHHARQAEDDSDREVEGGRGRGRNAKAARPAKKATSMPKAKPIVKKPVRPFAVVKAATA
jgi:translation initiation factor IF-2